MRWLKKGETTSARELRDSSRLVAWLEHRHRARIARPCMTRSTLVVHSRAIAALCSCACGTDYGLPRALGPWPRVARSPGRAAPGACTCARLYARHGACRAAIGVVSCFLRPDWRRF